MLRVFSILLLVFIVGPFPVTAGMNCTIQDTQYTFTACDPLTKKRQSVQYYDKNCDPITSPPLRSPITVDCEQVCPSGMYFSANTMRCTACSPGTISKAQTVLINDFNQLPKEVATYCTPTPCAMWAPEGSNEVISSGNQSLFIRKNFFGFRDESVMVYFNIMVDVVNLKGGALKFSYRVECEKGYDGLAVFVNGTSQRNPDSQASAMTGLWATGLLRNWRNSLISLPYGHHEIGFLYIKDRNQGIDNGLDYGTDRAYLRNIELEGVTGIVDKCTPCPSGYYASEMSQSKCMQCDKDTFSRPGASKCTPCSQGQWAPPGSGTCFGKLRCQFYDYVASYSPCNRATNKRNQTWHLSSNKCEVSSITAPISGEVSCAPCMIGKFLNEKTKECETCPLGEEWNGEKCKACEAGTAAIPVLDYQDGFDVFGGEIPENFATMSCTGDCSTAEKPFKLASYPTDSSDHSIIGIRQSLLSGSSFSSVLSIPIELSSNGYVEVYYAFFHAKGDLERAPDGLSGFITVDGYDYIFDTTKVHTRESQKRAKISILRLKKGKHMINYTVRQDTNIKPEDMVDVVLLGIKVYGEKRGGVPRCMRCPLGHYCPALSESFIPCKPGYYANTIGSTQCYKCNIGFASGMYGSENCEFCGTGTKSNDDGTMCVNTCNISFLGYINYDLTPLRGKVFGPLLPATSEYTKYNTISDVNPRNTHGFYISPCTLLNTTDTTPSICTNFKDNDLKSTHACQRLSDNLSNNIGTYPSYTEKKNNLVLNLKGGDRCPSDTTKAIRSNITFVCDPNDVPGTVKYENENPFCQYNFILKSRHGCPICLESSFVKIKSDCNTTTGNMSITYIKKDWVSNCISGYEPPKPQNISCHICQVSDYDRVWSDCIEGKQEETWELKPEYKTCISNLTLNFTKNIRTCRKINAKIGINPFTIGILCFLGVIGFILSVLFALNKRHKRLQERYQQLASNNNDGVMEMVTPDNDNSCFGDEEEEEEGNLGGRIHSYKNSNLQVGKVVPPPPLD